MDEYIDQLLAEMQMPEPAQKVVRNILDEPIPETVKRRLLKPLFPRKISTSTPTSHVRSKKAVINVKNRDDHCLRWALRVALAYLRWAYPPPPHHPERPRWYPTEDGLNFQGIDAPTPISQIPKVEKLNNLAINVFGWDKGVTVYRLSAQPDGMPRINLLQIEKAGKFHYTWIKDLNRLLRDQSKHKERKHFCERYLHGYTREDLLEAHRPDCRGIAQTAVRVEMPEKGKNKGLLSKPPQAAAGPFHHLCGF